MSIELRHYQAGVTPAVIKYFRLNKGKHPVVALPTGAGKTYCIADLIKHCVSKWNVKVLVLSHVKEILEQNHASLSKYLNCDVGLNSSMLGRREINNVTVAGIQSVYRNPEIFKDFNLVIVDEAHLISVEQNTMYQKFLSGIGKYICVGFTATPFRLGTGYIYGDHDGAMFDDLCYDWTTSDKFVQLVNEGFLSKLTTKRTELEMDTTGIKLKGGDFNEKQLSDRFDREIITNEAIKEMIAAGKDRKKWLIFAIDIKHAEHIAEMLIRNGIPTAPVHSQMKESGFCREKVIKEFKNGKYKCVVNVNILTTGFDEPGIDLIGILRPTNSPILHVQMLGRGSRIIQGKSDCLVLDFAGNTERLGPINDVLVKTKGKGKDGGDPIVKTCPGCNSILPPAIKICPDCGHEFKFQHGLSAVAGDYKIIEDGKNHWIEVEDVEYSVHSNFGSPSSLKVTYKYGKQSVSEFICVEHKGFAKHKADHWVKYRGGSPCNSAHELLEQAEDLNMPIKILVQKKNKYFIIKDSKFNSA